MMDFIMVPAVMTIITLGVYKLFELFVCKKERIMLIEKMDERGLLPQMDTPKLRGSSFSFSALKIGCLLAGMGLGLLDRKSTRLNSSHRHTSRMPSSA